jgi:hypothetical protein
MKRAKALRHATRFIILMISFEAEFAVRRIQLCAVTVTKVYMGDISLKKKQIHSSTPPSTRGLLAEQT